MRALMDALEPRLCLSSSGPSGPSSGVLVDSTLLGGDAEEVFREGVVAADGTLYLAGSSLSADAWVPAGGVDRTPNGQGDAVVVRLAGDLSAVLAGTFLGGSGWEKNTYGVALDAGGNVYVAGETRSAADFPTTAGAVQRAFGGGEGDAFVAKLDASLSRLLYATYLGGSDLDAARGGLAVDPLSGAATVVGWTESRDFPTTAGSYRAAHNGGTYDAFAARLAPDGRSLAWSTLLGGSFGTQWYDSEYAVGATLAPDGSVLLTGSSTSADFPTTPGAYDRTHAGNGSAQAYLARLSADGKALLWATLLGGDGAGGGDFAEHRLAADAQGNLVIVGETTSASFPVTTGRTHRGGGGDVYVAKVSADGARLLWATLVGGSGEDTGFGPVVDLRDGSVYVGGATTSRDFPATADAYQAAHGGGTHDAVLVRLDGASGALAYATYLGGGGRDYARFAFGDGRGHVYLTGTTDDGAAFPTTPNAARRTPNPGPSDAFVSHFYFAADPSATPAEVSVSHGGAGGPVVITDGQTAPISAGSVRQGAAGVDVNFTIENTGGQPLTLGSVTLGNNTGFVVITQPATELAAGETTSFVLRMLTTTTGAMAAAISFTNNDADENPFDFTISGTVTPPPELTIGGTPAADTVYVKRVSNEVHVWLNADSASAAPTHTGILADLASFAISTGDGDDHITFDFSSGSPLPDTGLAVAGDAGGDQLTLIGGPADDTIAFDGTMLGLGVSGGGSGVATTGVESLEFLPSAGADALAFTGTAAVSLAGAHALASLALDGAARAIVAAGGSLRTGALTIVGGSVLDIGDSELVVLTTPQALPALLGTLAAAIRSARDADPRWSGPGLTSSAVATDPLAGLAAFGGRPDADSILVTGVYNGDANADGRVNADDYFRIDQGFLAQPTNATYAQGDFNYDGRINADDYFLIDQAFLGQNGALASRESVSSSAVLEQTKSKRSRAGRQRPSLFNAARRVTRPRR